MRLTAQEAAITGFYVKGVSRIVDAVDELELGLSETNGELAKKADGFGDEKTGRTVAFSGCTAGESLYSAKADINAVQDLSHGVPSAGNTCPITGWKKTTLHRYGKNLFNMNAPFANPNNTELANTNKRIFQPYTYCLGGGWSNYFFAANVTGYSVSNGTMTVSSKSGYSAVFAIPVTAGKTYILTAESASNNACVNVCYYKADGTAVTYG